MGWLTYRLSGSVWLLGVVAFCGNVGIVVFGTFARRRRRSTCPAPQRCASRSRSTLLQAARCSRCSRGRVTSQVWHLIVLVRCGSASSHAFDVPLRQSLWVHLVEDRADLPNAIALNSFLGQCRARRWARHSRACCSAVVSEAVCFALNALSFVAVIVAIGADAVGARAWTRAVATAASGRSWVEGYRFVVGLPPARAMLIARRRCCRGRSVRIRR